jgi:hypothetical protein
MTGTRRVRFGVDISRKIEPTAADAMGQLLTETATI